MINLTTNEYHSSMKLILKGYHGLECNIRLHQLCAFVAIEYTSEASYSISLINNRLASMLQKLKQD